MDGHNVKNGDITGGKRETITISIFNYKKHEGKAKTRMKLALRKLFCVFIYFFPILVLFHFESYIFYDHVLKSENKIELKLLTYNANMNG